MSSEIKRSQHTNEIDGKRDEWGIIFFDNSILLKKKSFVIRFRMKCILIGKMDFELFYWIEFKKSIFQIELFLEYDLKLSL